MGDSYVTATHPALNSVCCYTLGGKPPCLKKKEDSGYTLHCTTASYYLQNAFHFTNAFLSIITSHSNP